MKKLLEHPAKNTLFLSGFVSGKNAVLRGSARMASVPVDAWSKNSSYITLLSFSKAKSAQRKCPGTKTSLSLEPGQRCAGTFLSATITVSYWRHSTATKAATAARNIIFAENPVFQPNANLEKEFSPKRIRINDTTPP